MTIIHTVDIHAHNMSNHVLRVWYGHSARLSIGQLYLIGMMEVCVLPNPALSKYGLLNLSFFLSNHFIVTTSQFYQSSILISTHVVQI